MSAVNPFVGASQADSDEASLEAILQAVPVLRDQQVLDLLNGLEVVKEQVRVAGRRTGRWQQAWDQLTGTAAARQQIIGENVAVGLESVAAWLSSLEGRMLYSERGTILIADKLIAMREALCEQSREQAELRSSVADVIAQVDRLRVEVSERHEEIRSELAHLGLTVRARNEIDRVFNRWEAGWLNHFAPLTQVALTLEMLFWSAFGIHYREKEHVFREEVRDRCLVQIRRVSGMTMDELALTDEWLRPVRAEPEVHRFVIAALFREASPDRQPINYTMVAEVTAADEGLAVVPRPAGLPHVMNPTNIVERLRREAASRVLPRRSIA